MAPINYLDVSAPLNHLHYLRHTSLKLRGQVDPRCHDGKVEMVEIRPATCEGDGIDRIM